MVEPKRQNERAEDKLFNFRPLLFTAIALCIGIFFGYVYVLYGVSAWWACLLLPFAASPFFFCTSRKRAIAIALALLCLLASFLVGFGLFTRRVEEFTDCGRYNGEYAVVGKVVEKTEYESYLSVTVEDIVVDGTREDGKLVAYLPTSFAQTIRLSDEVLLRGRVKTKASLTDDYGFRAYAIGDDIRFTMSAESCTVTDRGFELFALVRERMETVIYAGMDETSAAVTMAILTGDTSGIDEGLLSNVRRGGVAHIFAVSGLHIGALYAFALWLVSKTGLKNMPKPVRFFAVAALLFFYSGVCGFSASVVRALVTCLIFYASRLVGYGSDNLERIGASALVVLLLSPTSLFEVGFQLSFIACLGIALLARPIKRALTQGLERIKGAFGKRKTEEEKENHPPTLMEEIENACISFLAVTLSAQIATTPVSVAAFGYFSVWSLLLNCLFVPLVSVCFSVLLAFVVIACVLPVAASAVALYVPSTVWSVLLLLFQLVEFSALTVSSSAITGGAFVCYYGGLVFLTDKWNLSRALRWAMAAVFLSGFCVILFAPVVKGV
ncbi:MAG: ComEC/Rec2 family competence protein [Clostridia bacterium]|nr:ComEC/Rec2 family competence protein [Clostridia bacterium]